MSDLDDYLSFRHTRAYSLAQDKNRIAWIDYHQGYHLLSICDIPNGDSRIVASSESDDGQPFSKPKLSADGRYLLYVLGGDPDTSGYTPNPHALITPATQKLLLINLENPKPHPEHISSNPLASFSPDSSTIAWVDDNCVYSRHCADCNTSKLFQVRGKVTDITWSPDSRSIAFVCRRGAHAYIGRYCLARDKIQWIAPGFDRDVNPCWSPDGQHLTFYRFHGPEPDVAEVLFANCCDSFSVVVTDMKTLASQVLWQGQLHEESGLSLQEGNRPLIWQSDNEIIFTHEESGWDHCYQINIETGKTKPLTKGQWLVRDYYLWPGSRELLISHNQDKRHHFALAKINTDNGAMEPVQGQWSRQMQAWQPCQMNNRRFIICLTATSSKPCRLTILDTDTGHIYRPDSGNDFPPLIKPLFLTPVSHTLKAQDNNTFYSQVIMPTDQNGPMPAVLNIHGGPWIQSLPSFHQQLIMSFQYAFNQFLVSRGFLVMDINYRGSSGYGKAFRQALDRGWYGASDYTDILTAGRWLNRHPKVDHKRVAVIGESWGGFLGAMALARDSSLFRAGVILNGCHHFPRELRRPNWKSKQFDSDRGEIATESIARATIALESSPWSFLDNWMSPVLLVHGDNDEKVDFEESQQLCHALHCRGVQVESLAIPDETHDFLLHSNRLSICQKSYDFLMKHLK